MKLKNISSIIVILSIFIVMMAVNTRVTAQLDIPPALSFQADIYGDSNPETIEYLSDLAFHSWGGFGTNAHIFRARLQSSGEEIAYAVSASTPDVFSFEIINNLGERHTIGMPSSAYPNGSVEAVSAIELHFVWEINDPNLHIKLHRYASLKVNQDLITGYYIEERFVIENLGDEFTLMKFSEYLHMDDRARLRDFDADTREETVLAINSFTTSGYPVFGKIYLRNEEIFSQFASDGVYATVSHQPFRPIPTGSQLEISKAAYISAIEKNALGAEGQLAQDACIFLGCNPLPTRWYMRSYRTDDAGAMFVNGLMVVGSRYSFSDTGWMDVNRYWKQGTDNYLSMASFNSGGGSTWGFQLRRNESTLKSWVGDGATTVGLTFTKIVLVDSEGTYTDYQQPLPGTQLDGDWSVEFRVNRGLGFVLVENLPVVGSIRNISQTRNISDLLGQQDNYIHLNVWGEQTGTLEWSFVIRNGGNTVWQNQMTIENAPRRRVHHILLVIDADGNVYPKYDYPINYLDRTRGSSTNFESAFNNRTTSLFDHEYPNYNDNDYMWPYTGVRGYNPDSFHNCTLPYCYDGHPGYDIDDLCQTGAACLDRAAVYPVADGAIISAETGWINDSLGCQVAIDHGNGWKTIYAHLRVRQPEWDPQNPGFHVCDGITQTSGFVTSFDQIGIIGCSGSGCEPAYEGARDPTHLHFEAKHSVSGSFRAVDPSGWDRLDLTDPWVNHTNGATSYPQWIHRERIEQVVDTAAGGQLSSSSDTIQVTIPAGYYSELLTFNLSNVPATDPANRLLNTGISFVLNARDGRGNDVHQLNQNVEIRVNFNSLHITDLVHATLAIYTWEEASSSWIMLPTTVDLENQIAIAQVDHLSMFAFMGASIKNVYLPVISR
jgi:hypothetical protein